MKNFILIIVLVLFGSCQKEKKEKNYEVSTIEKPNIKKRNEVFIQVNDTVSSFFTNLFLDELQDMPDMLYLGQKHNKNSLTIPTRNFIKIRGGEPWISFFYELKIEKGDSLLIDIAKLEINKSKEIAYPNFTILNSNKNWSESNFDYLLYKYNINHSAIVIDENNPRENKYESENVYRNAIKLLDSLIANSSISNTFYSTCKTNQKLKFANYEIRKAKRNNTNLNIDSLNIALNDKVLLGNKEYISFLRNLILYQHFKNQKKVLFSAQFDFVNDQTTFLNDSTKEILLDSYLKSIYLTEKPKFEKYLTRYFNASANQELKDKWQLVIDQQNTNSKKLNATNRNIGILSNLISDKQLTFEEVLSRHKGKIVLVDFWASWCAPCRKEMPELKKLKLKFNESEFQIIEISIDKDYSAWERASKLEGISNYEDNYIILKWKESNLYKTYNIESIPRYLLFNKDGKIINDNAPRPSETKLEELIKASI